MADTPLALETRGLTKRFGREGKAYEAVSAASLHVRQGRIYGLLGPNGAGKSTTLKMVTGALRPTTGKILVEGRAWTREELYGIGSLIETAPLYPNLNAQENLEVKARLFGIGRERVREVLGIVGLEGTGSKRAGRFSMGMKQRLGIGLAILARPKLLILDEPTNGLDPLGIEELRALMRGFADKGMSLIVSSHILSEIEQVADDIGIIVGGRLAYEAPLEHGEGLEGLFMEVCRKEGRR